jgi:hypothetical protein
MYLFYLQNARSRGGLQAVQGGDTGRNFLLTSNTLEPFYTGDFSSGNGWDSFARTFRLPPQNIAPS